MLNAFDWVRRSRTGSELMATIKYLGENPECFEGGPGEIGPPISALTRPCKRCWIYSRVPDIEYCTCCHRIIVSALKYSEASHNSVVLWAFVNQVPEFVYGSKGDYLVRSECLFIPDDNHFLLVMSRKILLNWFRELFVYHGDTINGLFQFFPTVGLSQRGTMGDILIRAHHHEIRFPMDMLRVRFYPDPFNLFSPEKREEKGILTFEAKEFFRLMESASIFKSLLKPNEQEILLKLAHIKDPNEEKFYWGRFMGFLTSEAKDMLNSWGFRQWPANQIQLLYELLDYVPYHT